MSNASGLNYPSLQSAHRRAAPITSHLGSSSTSLFPISGGGYGHAHPPVELADVSQDQLRRRRTDGGAVSGVEGRRDVERLGKLRLSTNEKH